MIPLEICQLIVELNKYRTGYGELSKIIDRIQSEFEDGVVEIYRKLEENMTAVENINPEKEPVPASWIPRVITGGKGPPEGPPTGENWLSQLAVGTVFLARQGPKTVDWEEYYLLAKPNFNLFYLKVSLPDGNIWTRRVDPKLFCNYHKDYQVLYVHKDDTIVQETKEEDNGSTGECDPL